MKKNTVLVLIGLVFVIFLVAIISWFVFPDQHDIPGGFLAYLSSAAVGVIASAGVIFGIIKVIKEVSKDSDKGSTNQTKVTIPGEFQAPGSTFFVAENVTINPPTDVPNQPQKQNVGPPNDEAERTPTPGVAPEDALRCYLEAIINDCRPLRLAGLLSPAFIPPLPSPVGQWCSHPPPPNLE